MNNTTSHQGRLKSLRAASIGNALELFDGPLAVQVSSLDSAEMIKQAKSLSTISSRIIVKIPCIQEGYTAMHVLQQEISLF